MGHAASVLPFEDIAIVPRSRGGRPSVQSQTGSKQCISCAERCFAAQVAGRKLMVDGLVHAEERVFLGEANIVEKRGTITKREDRFKWSKQRVHDDLATHRPLSFLQNC